MMRNKRKQEETPERRRQVHYMADGAEQIGGSMGTTRLRDKLDKAFQTAIVRAGSWRLRAEISKKGKGK